MNYEGGIMKALIFIGLKIVEIGGIVFGPYYAGRYFSKYTWFYDIFSFISPWSVLECWAAGFVFLVVVGGGIGIGIVFVGVNLELTKKIRGKLK